MLSILCLSRLLILQRADCAEGVVEGLGLGLSRAQRLDRGRGSTGLGDRQRMHSACQEALDVLRLVYLEDSNKYNSNIGTSRKYVCKMYTLTIMYKPRKVNG